MTDSQWSTGRYLADWHCALALGAFLALVYLVTFSGQIRSIDEYALYARAEAIIQGYQDDLSQLAFSGQHNQVGQFEPVQPYMAAPLYALSQHIPSSSSIATVLLLNVYVTAATGSLLYVLLRKLALDRHVSVLAVLAWGLGSSAWPYSRFFFREPLNALLWVVAITLCVYWLRTRKVLYLIACAVAVGVCVGVKSSSAVAIPWLLLAAFVQDYTQRSTQRWLIVACIAVAVCAVFFVKHVDLATLTGRLRGAIHLARTYDWSLLPLQLYGQLFSPIKGLLFYSPVIVGALPGMYGALKRNGRVTTLTLAISLSVFVLYSTFPAWHGGRISWGPRYFVPLLPFMALPYAHALSSRRWPVRMWALLWGGIGVGVQLAASTTAWTHAVWPSLGAFVGERLVGLDGIPWYSLSLWDRSPVIEVVAGWGKARLDLAWARALVDGELALNLASGLELVALSALSGVCLVAIMRRAIASKYLVIASCVAAIVGSLLVSIRSGKATEDTWGLGRNHAQEVAAAINSASGAPYDVVFVSNDFAMHYWLGLLKGSYRVTWLSPHAMADEYVQTTKRLQGESVYLFVDHVHMPVDTDPQVPRRVLAQELYEVDGRWIGDNELFLYQAPRSMQPLPATAAWEDGIRLLSLAISSTSVSPGDTLLIDLELSADNPLQEDYTLFVNLVSPKGETISGRDGQPHYGGLPTSGWPPGESIAERRAIRIPWDAGPTTYRLVCGWYDTRKNPVPLTTDTPTMSTNYYVTGTVQVVSPR